MGVFATGVGAFFVLITTLFVFEMGAALVGGFATTFVFVSDAVLLGSGNGFFAVATGFLAAGFAVLFTGAAFTVGFIAGFALPLLGGAVTVFFNGALATGFFVAILLTFFYYLKN